VQPPVAGWPANRSITITKENPMRRFTRHERLALAYTMLGGLVSGTAAATTTWLINLALHHS
jgi:hypothetical protein